MLQNRKCAQSIFPIVSNNADDASEGGDWRWIFADGKLCKNKNENFSGNMKKVEM